MIGKFTCTSGSNTSKQTINQYNMYMQIVHSVSPKPPVELLVLSYVHVHLRRYSGIPLHCGNDWGHQRMCSRTPGNTQE